MRNEGGFVTQHDVARAAGVHRATVSRALDPRCRGLLDADTVRRITEAAERLGYRPNALARGLKTRRSLAVGLVVPDLASPEYAPLIASLEGALHTAGYTILVASSGDDRDGLLASVERLVASRVDGIVVATGRKPPLEGVGTPLVIVGAASARDGVPSISIDHGLGLEIAVGHLLRLGHRRIGLIAGRRTTGVGAAHHDAYERALVGAGVALDSALVEIAEPQRATAGAEACAALFYRRADPTAIVATSDGAALGCYSALAEFGLKVPDDISIVGYGNSIYGRYLSPPLTTVSLPTAAMGVQAANRILGLVGGGDAGVAHVQLRPYLVHRLSTGRAPMPPRRQAEVRRAP
jgi:LacI family transcriptional regulator, galactose operon repressor